MAKSRDLFDDTTMTFGEHLDVLRSHLIRALLWLVLALVFTLTFGNYLVDIIRTPLDQALKRNKMFSKEEVTSFWGQLNSLFGKSPKDEAAEKEREAEAKTAANPALVTVSVRPSELLRVLHQADPERFPAAKPREDEQPVPLELSSNSFREFWETTEQMNRPVTLNVQEAFMMYIKVAFVAGFILASPMIFYEFWRFVAAGLYPHERRYVHVYMPLSIGLFLLGVVFCFYLALPLVLDFLLSYNRWLQVSPQLRLSEWVSFVILLPVMFGVSFQLPLVMLFLERIGIFETAVYRARRRLAVFVMAIAAMMLSPGGDLGSMTLMFIPLVLLYELGIVFCTFWKVKKPFEEPALS